MPETSICPACQQPVAIPADQGDETAVQCPHCEASFSLADVRAMAVDMTHDDVPAELLVVDAEAEPADGESESDAALDFGFLEDEEVAATESPEEPEFDVIDAEADTDESATESEGPEDEEPEADGDPESGEVADEEDEEEGEEDDDLVLADDQDEEESAEDQGPEVRCPCCREAFALENLLLADGDTPLGKEAAAAITAQGDVRGPASAMGLAFGDASEADEDHSEFQLKVEEPATPAAGDGAFEFASPVPGATDDGQQQKPAAARGRRRREQGGFKDIVGAILGGFAGLLITYYLLNLIGGQRFDMLDIYLPGVKHTAVHRPDWLGGPPAEEEFDSGVGDNMGAAVEPPSEPPEPEPPSEPEPPPMEEEPPEDLDLDAPTEPPAPAYFVGPIDAPAVSSDDLGRALKAVSTAMDAVGPLDENGYEAWCQLAEAVTYVDRNDGGPQLQNRLDAVRRLLKKLTSAEIEMIGQWGSLRIADADRASSGVLLAGTAMNPNTSRDEAYLMGLVTAGTEAKVVVASPAALPVASNDTIVALGAIIDQPQGKIQGLEANFPQLVWTVSAVKASDGE